MLRMTWPVSQAISGLSACDNCKFTAQLYTDVKYKESHYNIYHT